MADKWEYLLVDTTGEEGRHGGNLFKPEFVEKLLDEKGEEGWELVHITESPHLIRAYFKRKKIVK